MHWQCGVCQKTNPAAEDTCCICARPRFPAWAHIDGEPIELGQLLDVPGVGCGIVSKVNAVRRQVDMFVCPDEESLEPQLVSAARDQVEGGRAARVTDTDDPRAVKYLGFGVCGQCERVYRVHAGPTVHMARAERGVLQREMDRLVLERQEQERVKAEWRKLGHAKNTLECTAKIKKFAKRMAVLTAQLEPAMLWCPFCTWQDPLARRWTSGGGGGTS